MEQLEQRDAVRILQCQSAAVAAFPDQERVMSVIAAGAREVVGATFAVVEMLEGDELVYRSVVGLARELIGGRLKASTSLSGLCVREGQLVSCEDTETDERIDREATRRLGAGSMVIAPLRHGERVFGVLKAGARQPRSFGDRERKVVSIFAGILGTILARSLEQELEQRSSALLADAFMQAATGMCLVSLDGGFLKVNAALSAMIGYSAEELLRFNFQTITHPDDLGGDLSLVSQLLHGELETYELEKRYLHRLGQVVWVRISVRLAKREDGSPQFFVVNVQDITARVDAEYQATLFFEKSGDLQAIFTDDGQIDRVNAAWTDVLGWSEGELLSHRLDELLCSEETRTANPGDDGRSWGQRVPPRFRARYRCKDGSHRWLDWTTRHMRNRKVFGTARDVTQQVLYEHELRLWMRALQAAHNGILITDPTRPGNPIIYVNHSFERMTGYGEAELVGRGCGILQGDETEQPGVAQLREAMRAGVGCHTVLRNFRKSGELFLNSLTIAPVRDAAGSITHYVGVADDITSRVAADQEAFRQGAIMRAVFDSMQDVVMVADQSGDIIHRNDVAKRLFSAWLDHGPDQWQGQHGIFLADKKTPCPPSEYPMARALRGEPIIQQELWMIMPGWPEGRWHSVTGSPVCDDSGHIIGAVNVGRDITEKKQAEEEIRQSALTDELTGLHNRRGLMSLGEHLLRTAKRQGYRVALLFLDLDGMKAINDRHGHEVGDEALSATATILRSVCRSSDVVARLGGDEFVVLTGEEVDELGASVLKRRIVDACDAYNRHQRRFQLSLSIGITLSASDGMPDELSRLLANADSAMYQIKRSSRASL